MWGIRVGKGVETVEKLWCVCVAVERPHHYRLHRPFLMTPWDADELKGWREGGTYCRTFSILKDTVIKLRFQTVLFYCFLQCGDSGAVGGVCPCHFSLLVTTHWEWKPECLRHPCIFNVCNRDVYDSYGTCGTNLVKILTLSMEAPRCIKK